MVATLRPTTRAIVRMGMRWRRSCSIRVRSSLSTVERVWLGRELRSIRPASPCVANRCSHFLAVRGLMPAAAAAGISPINRIRSINNLRPAKVVLAFLWLFIRFGSLGF